MCAEVKIDWNAVRAFTFTDPGLQVAMDRAADELAERIKRKTPLGKGLDVPKYGSKVATAPGWARKAIYKKNHRWYRRVTTRDIAGHITEFGSPPGIDSIGRRHYRTRAYRPFISAALSSMDLGRFVPKSKKGGGDAN